LPALLLEFLEAVDFHHSGFVTHERGGTKSRLDRDPAPAAGLSDMLVPALDLRPAAPIGAGGGKA
jgi:hypothetical protein